MLSLLLLVLSLAQQAQRTPVPDVAAQKEKESLVREVFKSDYAKKARGDRIALAKKLLQQGIDTLDDPSARYVLLREAKDLAASAGDVATAVSAIEETANFFNVDALRLKLGLLTGVAQEARLAEDAKAAAESLLNLADQSDALDDFETSEKALTAAAATARKTKDVALAGRAEVRLREIAELKSSVARVKAAREVLQVNPADPAANFEVGRFECFVKGNWEAGLPLLGRGSNEALKILAERDLSNPEDVQSQIDLGDAWKNRSEKESFGKRHVLGRAAHWYLRALPQTTGLSKVKIEKSIAAIAASGPPSGKARRDLVSTEGLVGWWTLDEVAGTVAEDVSGQKMKGQISGATEWTPGYLGKALKFKGGNSQVTVPDAPALRITGDLTIAIWFRKDQEAPDWSRLIGKGDQNSRNYGLFVGGVSQRSEPLLFQQWDASKRELVALSSKTVLPVGKWHHVAVVVRGDEVELFLDGRVDASRTRAPGAPVTSDHPLTFGYPGFLQPLMGSLDDIRIYRRALLIGEIQVLASMK